MAPPVPSWLSLLAGTLLACALCACRAPQKTLIVDSDPTGATIWINGERQESVTPVRVPFEWYGSFEVRIEKEGYNSLATDVHVESELDGYPVFDLLSLPFSKDRSFRRTVKLTPIGTVPPEVAIDRGLARAKVFRARMDREIREPGTPTPSPEAPGDR